MSILLIVIVAWVAVAAFFIALLAVAGRADRELEQDLPPAVPAAPEPEPAPVGAGPAPARRGQRWRSGAGTLQRF